MLFRIRDEREPATQPPEVHRTARDAAVRPTAAQLRAPKRIAPAAIVQRLNQTPGYLQVATSNLQSSSDARIEAAREATNGVINLIRGEIAEGMPAGMKANFESAADGAIAALEAYRNSLADLPSTDDWRAGAQLMHRKLELDTRTPRSPPSTH